MRQGTNPLAIGPNDVAEVNLLEAYTWVQISNPGPSWVYIPQIKDWTAPGTINKVEHWGLKPNTAEIHTDLTPSGSPPAPIKGTPSPTTIQWSNKPLSSTPGFSSQQFSIASAIPSITAGVSTSVINSSFLDITLPVGTQSLNIGGIFNTGVGTTVPSIYQIAVSGKTTSFAYYNSLNLYQPPFPISIPVLASQDPVVTLILGVLPNASGTGFITIFPEASSSPARPPSWPRPFDWFKLGSFNNGTASLTAPAVAGRTIVLAAYNVRPADNPATAYGTDVVFKDGNNVTIWLDGVAVTANVDQADHILSPGGLMVPASAPGFNLNMSLNVSVPSSVFVDMSFGGYYV